MCTLICFKSRNAFVFVAQRLFFFVLAPATSFPGSLLVTSHGASEGREEERPWERDCSARCISDDYFPALFASQRLSIENRFKDEPFYFENGGGGRTDRLATFSLPDFLSGGKLSFARIFVHLFSRYFCLIIFFLPRVGFIRTCVGFTQPPYPSPPPVKNKMVRP